MKHSRVNNKILKARVGRGKKRATSAELTNTLNVFMKFYILSVDGAFCLINNSVFCVCVYSVLIYGNLLI